MTSNNGQARFSEELSHHFLKPKPLRRAERKKPEFKRSRKKRFTHKSTTRFGQLKQQADLIRERSDVKTRVYADPRLYFLVEFSDDLSWPVIQGTLESMKGSLVKVIDGKTVKLAIDKGKYPDFVLALSKGHEYVQNVRETILSEVVDQTLSDIIKERPEDSVNVTIEVGDASGLKDAVDLESAVQDYLKKKGLGEIGQSYVSDKFAIFNGVVKAKAIPEIVQAIDVIERIRLTPEVILVSGIGMRPQDNLALASIISLTQKARNGQKLELPMVCAIDSGVNRNHELIRDYVAETYDFTTNDPNPCDDRDGHGSMVAGLVIRGGNLATHHEAVAKVVMVKGFNEARRPILDTIFMIDRSVRLFLGKTKVFSLSFAARGPDPSRTRALDDLVYSKGIVVVACAGNIPIKDIEQHLKDGETYPEYLSHHTIYYPGDTDNIIAVGSYTPRPSNWIRENSPSPFTPMGTDIMKIKPDMLEDGGNLNYIEYGRNIVDLDHTGVGVQSTGLENKGLVEDAGTSFSTPAVASLASRVLSKYREASPFLVKAMILSSCNLLLENGKRYSELIQGYGVPRAYEALNASRWKACYLLQGDFSGDQTQEYHGYSFRFPNNADRLKVTFVVGRPAGSKGYFTFRLKKAGVKFESTQRPDDFIGSKETRRRITTTYQELYDVKKAGKGNWWIGIVPHFDKSIGADSSLKYGCVITIESTKNQDVYSDIAKWVASLRPIKAPVPEVVQPA